MSEPIVSVETTTRSVDPLGVSGTFGYNTAALEKAFSQGDTELFFDLFFNWPYLLPSQRLFTLAKVAELVEADEGVQDAHPTLTHEEKGIPA